MTVITAIPEEPEVFTVEGQLILTIDKQVHKTHITLHNTNGYPVATLGIDGSEAGYLSLRNVEGVLVAYLDVETAGARLILQDHEQNGGVVLFGGDSGDNHGGGMNIIHTTGGISIALSSEVEGGKLTIYDGQVKEQELLVLPYSQS